MTLPHMPMSTRLIWVITAIAVIAIGTATGLGVLFTKEIHDTHCARQAAGDDRTALTALEERQRDLLSENASHRLRFDVVAAIDHYVATVHADDKTRTQC